MKLGFIDVGSNSVRLMTWADGKSLYKRILTTRLGEGLQQSGAIRKEAAARTADAIAAFRKIAAADGAENVFVFATEALRAAKNGKEVRAFLERKTGLPIDLLSGQEEAEVGLLGALGEGDGGMIDVGGASSEVTVRQGGKIAYAKSVPVGAVRVYDACGQDKHKIEEYLGAALGAFRGVPAAKMTAIGGTATALAALDLALQTYDGARVTGHVMTVETVAEWAQRLLSLTVSERRALPGMDQGRVEIIGGGAMILCGIVRQIGAKEIRVSDEDNLEGYARRRAQG